MHSDAGLCRRRWKVAPARYSETVGPERKKNYARSFSCGIVGVPRNHDKVDLDTLLHEADEVMYNQKREHKKEYQSELGI